MKEAFRRSHPQAGRSFPLHKSSPLSAASGTLKNPQNSVTQLEKNKNPLRALGKERNIIAEPFKSVAYLKFPHKLLNLLLLVSMHLFFNFSRCTYFNCSQLENQSKLKIITILKSQAHITHSPAKETGVDDLIPLKTHQKVRNCYS